MTKNDQLSLLESKSPHDYPILTPLVSFISLSASFEAGLIHSWGTLTFTDIDHVRIMKSSVMKPTPKRGGITSKSDPKHASIHKNLTPPDPYIGSICSKTRRYKGIHNWHAGQSSHESYVNLRPFQKKYHRS